MPQPILVIGHPERLRSATLRSTLTRRTNVYYIDPVFLSKAEWQHRQPEVERSKELLGRPISIGEMGCAVAHKNAHRLALETACRQKGTQWVLFVEDDARIPPTTLLRIEQVLGGTSRSAPSLISFFSDESKSGPKFYADDKFLGKLRKQSYWRAGTVCYALNFSALEYLQKYADHPVEYLADWPPFFTGINFLYHTKIAVELESTLTTIGDRKKFPIPELLVFYLLLIPKLRRISGRFGISVSKALYVFLVSPILRDVWARLRALVRR